MVRLRRVAFAAVVTASATALGLLACTPHTTALNVAHDSAPEAATTIAAVVDASIIAPAPAANEHGLQDPATYIEAHLPANGRYTEDPPKLTHKVQAGETAATVAAAYLELTELYTAAELATALIKNNANFGAGSTVEVPAPLVHKIGAPKDERLGWPEGDPALRGVFVTGTYANIKWAEIVNQVADHGLNAIVLDSKDYDGYVNYPSKAKIAIESGALRATNIPDLARAIRYAHWHGVRIISRVPCFHDPWTDKHLPGARLSIKYTPTNKPIHVDWLDPTSTEAQDYAIELAQESVDAGADEVQLDYVRFPVHLTHKVAVLPQKEERSAIIKAFVERVHAVTSSANARLSLDFFGVTATGIQDDIDMLGQDIATVAPEADAISLMSYPSHYGKGYMGFANPADHAEIIGIGNKAAVGKLKPTGAKTVFRTWLQAFPLGVTHYNSAYLLAQAKSAETSGGVGWLMWSPSCDYAPVWNGWPSNKAAVAAAVRQP